MKPRWLVPGLVLALLTGGLWLGMERARSVRLTPVGMTRIAPVSPRALTVTVQAGPRAGDLLFETPQLRMRAQMLEPTAGVLQGRRGPGPLSAGF